MKSEVERSRLDRKLAFVGLFCGSGALLTAVLIGKGIGISLTVFLPCLAYLLIERMRNDGITSTQCSEFDHRKLMVLLAANTSFLMLFLMYSIHSLSYQRPLQYFLAASFSCALIGLEIHMLPRKTSQLPLLGVLLQILLLSASLRLGVVFQFPGLVGSDWYHSILTDYIIQTGHIIPSNYVPSWAPEFAAAVTSYRSFPLMHIDVAIYSLLTSITSYKVNIVLTIGMFEIASLLFCFLLSREVLSDQRQALFATLILAVSSRLIFWGIWLVPQTLGLEFFIMMVYLLVSSRSKNQYPKLLLFFLMLFCITLAHTVSSFLSVLTILIFFVSEPFFSRVLKAAYTPPGRIRIYLPLFSILLVTVYWAHFTNFFTQEINSLLQSFSTGIHILGLTPAGKSYFSYELDNSGSYIFYGLGIFGGLTWFRKRGSAVKFSTLAASVAFLLSIYAFWFSSLTTILPDRWFPFALVLLAPATSEGLRRFLTITRRRYLTIALVLILFFSFAFLMTTNSDIDMDNPLIGTGQVVRYSYLSSEMTGANWAKNFSNPPLYTDALFNDYFFSVLETRMVTINFSSYVTPTDGTVIIRSYVYERPVKSADIFGSLTRVGTGFQPRLDGSMNRIYANGEVTLYTPGS